MNEDLYLNIIFVMLGGGGKHKFQNFVTAVFELRNYMMGGKNVSNV